MLFKNEKIFESACKFDSLPEIAKGYSIQINFQILRNFCTKIGMNTTANKLYHLNNMIGLNMLNLNFVQYKKLANIQFKKMVVHEN